MDEDFKTTENAFAFIPEEIKEYIYSDSFILSFDDFCKIQGLSISESGLLRGALYGYIVQIQPEEGLLERIRLISKTPTMNQSIISWVKTNVSDKLFQLVKEAYVNEEEEGIVGEQLTTPKSDFISPSGVNPTQPFTPPATIAPSKRVYTELPGTVPSSQTSTQNKPVVDVYRIDPNEK